MDFWSLSDRNINYTFMDTFISNFKNIEALHQSLDQVQILWENKTYSMGILNWKKFL